MKFLYNSILAGIFAAAPLLTANAQVVIGADKEPNPSALLEFVENKADSTSNRGILLPRVQLSGLANPAPLSRNVMGMMVYNKYQTVDKDVYVNDGNEWKPLTLKPASTSGQYLVLDADLKPAWETVQMPPVETGVYTLMNSQSRNMYQMYTFQNNSPIWFTFGDTINVVPRHRENRLIVTVQVLLNKEYDSSNPAGWIEYEGGVFIGDYENPKDSRTGKLAFQSFNNSRTFSPVTLHFVVENLDLGEQKLVVRFRRTASQGFNRLLYIGYDEHTSGTATGNVNLFNTSSSISMQYYEDKSSPML